MHAVIHNYKRGRHRVTTNQMIIVVEGMDSREKATKLVGKKVSYTTGKSQITGEVRAAHGNSGAIRVLFEKGMPGQSIGKEVTIN